MYQVICLLSYVFYDKRHSSSAEHCRCFFAAVTMFRLIADPKKSNYFLMFQIMTRSEKYYLHRILLGAVSSLEKNDKEARTFFSVQNRRRMTFLSSENLCLNYTMFF